MNDEFKFVSLLGRGGFAYVIEVEDTDGNRFALKKPFHPKKYLKNTAGVINMKELHIMAHIKHPYIQNANKIYFEDPCPEDNVYLPSKEGYDRMFFLMDRAMFTCHELVYIHKCHISHVKRAMFQITCAVFHLHKYGICHRDLKPGNFLCYYKDGVITAKLTDFGMTKPLNKVNRNSLHAGTQYYKAPELILKNMDYDFSMDIWSLGCAFFEMVSRKAIFKAAGDIKVLESIFKSLGSPDTETLRRMAPNGINFTVGTYKRKTIRSLLALNQNARTLFDVEIVDNLYNPGTLTSFCDLIERMLQFDPHKRNTSKEVLEHQFFSGYFKEHPYHYELWTPDINHKLPQITQSFPHGHKNWSIGANSLIDIVFDTKKYDIELEYSVRFHGLDIYNRFLLLIEPMDDPVIYGKIAYVCAYIASKYFLDEGSDHLFDLFPSSNRLIDAYSVVMLERTILKILDFEIYRPTCFTYVENRCYYSALFALCIKPKLMYNRPVIDIMKIFNDNVSSILSASERRLLQERSQHTSP